MILEDAKDVDDYDINRRIDDPLGEGLIKTEDGYKR